MSKVDSKKGFTIAELVVAMAIIFIVSATAIGLINTQNKIHQQTMQTVEATNMAENAIECFRWADSVEGFEQAFEMTGITIDGTTDNGKTTFGFEESNMNVTITIEGTTLTFEAVAKDNGKVILEESYTK